MTDIDSYTMCGCSEPDTYWDGEVYRCKSCDGIAE